MKNLDLSHLDSKTTQHQYKISSLQDTWKTIKKDAQHRIRKKNLH
jgi:hypothetical protein